MEEMYLHIFNKRFKNMSQFEFSIDVPSYLKNLCQNIHQCMYAALLCCLLIVTAS